MLQQRSTPRSRAPSDASGSSMAPDTHQSRSASVRTRTSHGGVTRNIHTVNRRTRSSIYSASEGPAQLCIYDKTNLDNACNNYVSDLASNSSWPDSTESTRMAREALMQANQRATNEGRDTSEDTKSLLASVSHHLFFYDIVTDHQSRSGMLGPDGGPHSRPRSITCYTSGTLPQQRRSARI